MKRVTFITTGQPTTNPRLVKEVECLIELGYQVRVIYCFYQQWAQRFDEELISNHAGVFMTCGGDPVNDKKTYLRTRIRQRFSNVLFKYLNLPGIAENAISRTHTEALALAKTIPTDIFVAHNLGALPAAVMAAKVMGAKVGYDAEDMHSAQYNSKNEPGYRLNKFIEERYFGSTDYFSAASPLIAECYAKSYPYLAPVVINNVFPKVKFSIKQHYGQGKCLRLFWFSQTIGSDRGLEMVIKAMAKTAGRIELHLMGYCADQYRSAFLALARECGLNDGAVQFHHPVAPDELFSFAANFDIGIASETASTVNRDICLTNKIFTYLQCGLAIVASDTQAQTLFLQQYPDTGSLYIKTSEVSLVEALDHYLKNPDELYRTRLANYELGQTTLNWENERSKFVDLIEGI
ncbi:glycosyltransferase [Mucilaginibacter sp. HD30]